MATIGERIKRARIARGMSGEHLALEAGYRNQSAIGNLENRGGGTGGKKLPEIARVLRVPVTWLIEGPDDGEIPFLEKPLRIDPLGRRDPTSFTMREPDPETVYLDASVKEAIALFMQLKTEQRMKAIDYMNELLTGTKASTNQDGPGESDPIPRPKAA